MDYSIDVATDLGSRDAQMALNAWVLHHSNILIEIGHPPFTHFTFVCRKLDILFYFIVRIYRQNSNVKT